MKLAASRDQDQAGILLGLRTVFQLHEQRSLAGEIKSKPMQNALSGAYAPSRDLFKFVDMVTCRQVKRCSFCAYRICNATEPSHPLLY